MTRSRSSRATSQAGIQSPSNASARASLSRGLENANSFDIKRSTVFADKEILRNVLNFVEYKDLLRSRLVNNFWNETVSKNPSPSPGTTKIWPKLRLHFPKQKKSAGESSEHRNSLEGFQSLPLIQKYHCPNLRFFRVDLRREDAQAFFITYGPYIRNLKLINCVMSLITFQRIVNKCPYLVGFELAGLFHCITQTESLNSSKDAITLSSFANLKYLILKSTYVRRTLHNLGLQDKKKRYHVPVQQIHPLVIHELLNSATQLRCINISGFGYSSVLTIMETLATNPVHTKLTNLEFYDISNGMDTDAFRGFARELSHMRLQTFALTFLTGKMSQGVGEQNNMDPGIQEIIVHHGETLMELDLTHCHVTEKIFNMASNMIKLGNLKSLILKGTKVYNIPRAAIVAMESLDDEDLVLAKEDDDKQTEQDLQFEIDSAFHEQIKINICEKNEDFGFKLFTPWDKACFLALGMVVLVTLGQLLTLSFGETGKLLYIALAGGILTFVQRMRNSS